MGIGVLSKHKAPGAWHGPLMGWEQVRLYLHPPYKPSWHGHEQLYFTISCSFSLLSSFFTPCICHISAEWSRSWIMQSDPKVNELVSKMYNKIHCKFLHYIWNLQLNFHLPAWIWSCWLRYNMCSRHIPFDCINHAVLLEKMKFYGVSGKFYNLVKSYLAGRY